MRFQLVKLDSWTISSYHVARYMLHMISARCVARDLHTTAHLPLERTCWRQFAAQWGVKILNCVFQCNHYYYYYYYYYYYFYLSVAVCTTLWVNLSLRCILHVACVVKQATNQHTSNSYKLKLLYRSLPAHTYVCACACACACVCVCVCVCMYVY